MPKSSSGRVLLSILGGVALALTIPALAAVGQTSPPKPVLHIGDTARLVARGAAVEVPVLVIVTCSPGSFTSLSVQVTQAIGRNIGHAYGSVDDLNCDGQPHEVEVFAVAQNLAFRPGEAFAQATLFACQFPFPPSDCSASDARVIRLVRDTPTPQPPFPFPFPFPFPLPFPS